MGKTPNKDQIQSYLNSYGMSPIRRLGQNFLIDDEIAKTIVSYLDISKQDIVAEIGPGFGALTAHLCEHQARLDLFEIDAKMCQFLADHYKDKSNVSIYHLDILKADLNPYTIIASNLPYYATTAIIEKIYRQTPNIKRAVFMIQKNAYPRISAFVGQEGYGPLSIMLGYIADISVLIDVKPQSFFPAPPVDSLVIGMNFLPAIDWGFVMNLDRVVRHIFQNRRKTILNNMSGLIASKEMAKQLLLELGIEPLYRPENITIKQYARLVDEINSRRVAK